MNKHLLETKLKSIAHYKFEIEKLEKAVKVNESVLHEVTQSLVEFFPFKVDDVIFRRDKMIKIVEIEHVYLSDDEDLFEIKVKYNPQSNGYGFSGQINYDRYPLRVWQEFKKIN